MYCSSHVTNTFKMIFQIIERILDFTRRQIMDMMAACDPCYRAIHRSNKNDCRFDG